MKQDFMEITEIPLGARDSELIGFSYTIPEGFIAEIKDGKVIVRKKEDKDLFILRTIYKLVEGQHWVNGAAKKEVMSWLRDKIAEAISNGGVYRK